MTKIVVTGELPTPNAPGYVDAVVRGGPMDGLLLHYETDTDCGGVTSDWYLANADDPREANIAQGGYDPELERNVYPDLAGLLAGASDATVEFPHRDADMGFADGARFYAQMVAAVTEAAEAKFRFNCQD